ncbi:penicillin-binding protein 1C [candidate division TA06 bacterium]|uniref:peptidoglycan glycosyltransferase n=1 Tax=candidate division TA06 bacterium TaxID=2250710 RepID=A0A523UXF7_UNCT6|nr:MAG: penicillin-binding protein 1C [candidate division TA06 bacterium]
MNRLKFWKSKPLRISASVIGGFILLVVLVDLLGRVFFPLPEKRLFPPTSVLVLDRHEKPLRIFTSTDDMWRISAPLSEVSPHLTNAVVTVEDRWFRYHFGVNPFSLIRAAITNMKAGKIVTGGSTLTMQIARLMEPKPRTLKSKMIEAVRAVQLEMAYSKNDILELYFNLAPYGGNIVGSASASYFYFNKHQKDITLGEAAFLAAVPNSPTAYRPDAKQSKAKEGREKVLRRLLKRGAITQHQFLEAVSEPLPEKRFPMPFIAPHLARHLKQRYPYENRLVSTIDTRIQILTRNVLKNYLGPLRKKGITQGAVVVMDTRTREVLALVGSLDFFDEEAGGQVNGALSLRSPGSALKPFVYTLAMDEGLVSPQSILLDVPVDYSGFRPLNYDERYRGVITVEEALTHSLNVPAVNLTARFKEEGLYSFLKEAGITTLTRPREYYGLSLILGGCEVKLLELTTLYAGLANGGEFLTYRLLLDQPAQRSRRLLGEGTAFIITDMLTKVTRPDFPKTWESSINLPKVAWKTGTSYGHKDAWSIGYSPDFTVGVWVGNFNGVGSPALVGAEAAAPILFHLFNALASSTPKRWFVKPDCVKEREVCALSGMVPSAHCSALKREYYVPGKSPHVGCTIHQPFNVDKKTGARLCSRCRINRKYETEVFEIWPPKIATWMERNGLRIRRIPEHYPMCPEVIAGGPPVIHSPSARSEYLIRESVGLENQKILLEASVSNSVRKIYWFLDSKLVFQGDPTERVFITPFPGKHTLTCMDEEGRSTDMVLNIR